MRKLDWVLPADFREKCSNRVEYEVVEREKAMMLQNADSFIFTTESHWQLTLGEDSDIGIMNETKVNQFYAKERSITISSLGNSTWDSAIKPHYEALEIPI